MEDKFRELQSKQRRQGPPGQGGQGGPKRKPRERKPGNRREFDEAGEEIPRKYQRFPSGFEAKPGDEVKKF